MCFNISISQFIDYIEKRFGASFAEPDAFEPVYHASAFARPRLPVIDNEDSDKIRLYRWGLVPFWVKDEQAADSISTKTFNAKAETVFEKPSFRTSIKSKRCLVLVDGFYEWHQHKAKKYPYYIRMADGSAFAMAGIWDDWQNKSTGENIRTFSIMTTGANELLAQIHNTRKRMPVILKQEDEARWLSDGLDRDEIKNLLVPYDGDDLCAHPVSKLITARGKNKNVPEVREKYEYEELKGKQLTF